MPGMATCPAYFGSHIAFQLVGAGLTFSVLYMSTVALNVNPAPWSPAMRASLRRSFRFGTSASVSFSSSPRFAASVVRMSSSITTSICGLSF